MEGKLDKNPDLVWRDEPESRDAIIEALEAGEGDLDAGWVIVVDGGEIHQFNLLAGDIWMLCDGTRDEGDIAAELAIRYDADPALIAADVNEFTSDCVKRGWLVRSGE